MVPFFAFTGLESFPKMVNSRHITRLMALCDSAALLDVCSGQPIDRFWVAYQDAYDRVVEPNPLGMELSGQA